MMTDINVIVEPNAVGPLERGSSELQQLVEGLGAELVPIHPGVADRELSRYYLVRLEEGSGVAETIDRLLACRDVEAAYVKPTDGAP